MPTEWKRKIEYLHGTNSSFAILVQKKDAVIGGKSSTSLRIANKIDRTRNYAKQMRFELKSNERKRYDHRGAYTIRGNSYPPKNRTSEQIYWQRNPEKSGRFTINVIVMIVKFIWMRFDNAQEKKKWIQWAIANHSTSSSSSIFIIIVTFMCQSHRIVSRKCRERVLEHGKAVRRYTEERVVYTAIVHSHLTRPAIKQKNIQCQLSSIQPKKILPFFAAQKKPYGENRSKNDTMAKQRLFK